MAKPRGGMSRLLGLGFVFGSKDMGSRKMTEDLGEGFDDLADAVDNVGKKTSGLQKFGNAIAGLNFLQLDRIGDSMERMADKAGVGPAATANSVEAFGVQFSKTYREATAGMGNLGKEVDKYRGKISGLAYSLEVDSNDLLAGVTTIVKTGSKLSDYGLTVRDMAGAMQANIIGGEDLAKVLTGLNKSYGLGERGAKDYLDQITALGQAHGVGKDAVQSLSSVIEAADPILAQFPNLSFENVSKSLYKLAIASQKTVGGTFQENMQNAIGVFQNLGEARGQLRDLIVGVGGEFPALAKELGIASGDLEGSLETVMSDPLTFAQNINRLLTTMDESDPARSRLMRSLQGMPPNFLFFAQANEKAAQAMRDVQKPVGDTANAFSKMSKKASGANFTFAESLERMSDVHEIRMRKIAKVNARSDREVVRRQKRVYKVLEETLKRQVDKGGALGKFAEIWYSLQRYGPINTIIGQLEKLASGSGPFSKIAKRLQTVMPMFEGFGEVLSEMAPSIIAFAVSAPVIGKFLSFILSPIKMIFGLATGLVKKALDPMSKRLAKRGAISKFFRGIPRFLGPLGMLATLGLAVYAHWDKFRYVAIEIWQALKDVGDEVAKGLGFADLDEVAQRTWTGIKDGLHVLWNDWLVPFGGWLRTNLPAAFGHLTGIAVTGIYSIVGSAKLLGNALGAAVDVGIAGFRLLAAVSPIGSMVRLLAKLAKWAAKTDIGKSMGLDKFQDTFKEMEGWLDPVQSVKDLGRKLGFAKKQLSSAGTQYMKEMERAGELGAKAATRVNAAVTTVMEGRRPGPSTRVEESRPRPKHRRRSRSAADDMAKKSEAAQAAQAASSGGSSLEGFLLTQSQIDEKRARMHREATRMGIVEGMREVVRRRPAATEPGGTEGRGGL